MQPVFLPDASPWGRSVRRPSCTRPFVGWLHSEALRKASPRKPAVRASNVPSGSSRGNPAFAAFLDEFRRGQKSPVVCLDSVFVTTYARKIADRARCRREPFRRRVALIEHHESQCCFAGIIE